MSGRIYDVVIIGYGPVGEMLAAMLGRQGRSVAIFERWQQRYPLPRAVCIDHEMYRMLSAIGLGETLPQVSHPAPMYRWFNADWKELLAIDWQKESISGGPEVNFVHQPTLEEEFDRAVRRYPGNEINLGWEAVAVSQTTQYAEVELRNARTGESKAVKARYVVGADGANSIVRQAIGGGHEDRGFEADWLVIDILPHEDVEIDVPAAAQWCNPLRPTTIVPAGVRNGRYFRRWEFMRLPHESVQDLENEAAAWKLLAPWVRPDQASMVRHKVYTFRSLLADRWRNGRLLIAGDAAHVMPPFMGQGMCAGLRDDWNLAWKLDLILDGAADPSLLDTYQAERRPHVSDIIDLSMYLGRMICIPDPEVAARRDLSFFDGSAPPPPPFPHLTRGLLADSATAGLLGPHGRVRMLGKTGRFDEVVGLGFVVVARHQSPLPLLSAEQRQFLQDLGAKIVHLAEMDRAPGAFVDLDDKFGPYMDAHRLQVMIVRPDFYLYGGSAQLADVSDLVNQLRTSLARYQAVTSSPSRAVTSLSD